MAKKDDKNLQNLIALSTQTLAVGVLMATKEN